MLYFLYIMCHYIPGCPRNNFHCFIFPYVAPQELEISFKCGHVEEPKGEKAKKCYKRYLNSVSPIFSLFVSPTLSDLIIPICTTCGF